MNRLAGIFSEDSLFGRLFGTLGDIIISNFLFVLCCLPVFTAGASLTSLHYVFLKRRRKSDEGVIRLFFSSFNENFKQSTAAWLLLLMLLLITLIDRRAFSENSALPGGNALSVLFTALSILFFTVGLYLFAVIAAFSNSLKNLILQSIFFAVTHLPQTLLMMAGIVLAVLLTLHSFFTLAFIGSLWIFFGFGLFAWLYSFLLIKIFEPYL